MLLLDFSQIVLASLAAMDAFNPSSPVSVDLVRHTTLNSVRANAVKFRGQYGQPIICCDGKRVWRKEVFPYYKARRKKSREESQVDWGQIFSFIDLVKVEMSDVLPYPVLEI